MTWERVASPKRFKRLVWNEEIEEQAVAMAMDKMAGVSGDRRTNQFGYAETEKAMQRHLMGPRGELMFKSTYKLPDSVFHDTGDYDFMLGKVRTEIKTATVHQYPQMHWDCLVSSCWDDRPHKQRCQAYVFQKVFMPKDRSTVHDAWAVGWIGSEEFWSRAQKLSKGTKRQYGEIKDANAYMIPISALYDMKYIKGWLMQ